MIDIHHHCLPGVDDGPGEWDEAVEMCRMAADEGIEAIVATPHVLRGRWRNVAPAELEEKLAMLREKVGDSPRLLLGSEYYFSHDMPETLRAGGAIIPLAGSRYVLIELAANTVPPMLEQPLYRAQLDGWTPIIAHPERNIVLQQKPEILAGLIRHGARTQITAGSLTGDFGRAAESAAQTFLRRRLVHFVATDAHNVGRRPPRTRAALTALEHLVGEEVAAALSRANPAAVLRNAALPYDPEPADEERLGLFGRIRSFFRPQ